MNQITIAGHLGADPEVRFTPSGAKVTTLRVAARVRRGKSEDTIWWKVSIWGDQFDKMMTFLKKGSAVMITGEVNKPEIFTGRDGTPQISMSMTAHHVGFSPFGKSENSSNNSGGYGAQNSQSNQQQGQSQSQPQGQTSGQFGGQQQSNDNAFASAGAGMSFGSGAGDSGQSGGFSDDEVPF